jgi:hypothetical protein
MSDKTELPAGLFRRKDDFAIFHGDVAAFSFVATRLAAKRRRVRRFDLQLAQVS